MRLESGNVVGNVFVIAADDQHLSQFPLDGEGLSIDGSTVAHEGAFQHTSTADTSVQEALVATVNASCS
jgi:hypothetical protein